MGSWSVNCGISNITINSGSNVVLLPIKKNKSFEGYLPYLPSTLPIFGTYDDYGGLEDIKSDDNTKLIENHFGITIDEFVKLFTEGLTYDRDEVNPIKEKMLNIEEIKDWDFMFIHGEVYEYMSLNSNNKGALSFGNKEVLELIGFKYEGNNNDRRYKHTYSYGELKVKSDGTWLHLENGRSIFNFTSTYGDGLTDIIDVPQDKMWINERSMTQLWEHLDDETARPLLMALLGLRYDYSIYNRRVNDITKVHLEKLKISDPDEYERLKLNHDITEEEVKEKTLVEKYNSNFRKYGTLLCGLSVLRGNLHCMSGYFKPYVKYLTPQWGEYEAHQILLNKFSEINKSHIYEE